MSTNQGYTYNPYEESEKVKQLAEQKAAAESAVSGFQAADFSKQQDYTDLYNKLYNRDPFSYDFNADALYQQYKDKYIQQGKMASADVMGQAAAMTGGYGNSYAATVGNQAYQNSLANLNDIIPELYQMAYNKYNQEGQDMRNMLSILSDERTFEYGKEMDRYNRLNADRTYYGTEYDNIWNRDYKEHTTKEGYNYQNHRDGITDEQWAKEYALKMAASGLTEDENGKIVASGGNYSDGGNNVYVDSSGNLKVDGGSTGGITQEIKTKAESFKSNADLAAYIDGLENSKAISPTEADYLYAQYADQNEKYVKDKDGKDTTTHSYTEMVKNGQGFTVVSKGGANLFGIDENAKVELPNGQTMTLKNLKAKLVAEGMKSSDATKYIKALQQNLDISSNWFFGL